MDEVACEEALFADVANGEVARQSVQIHAQLAGFGLLVASCQESGDDAGEDVSAACCGHSGVACGVEDDVSVGQAEGGVVAFQDDECSEVCGQVACFGESVVAVVAGSAVDAVELGGVGRHDDAFGQLLHPRAMVGEDVECVGVEHDGARCAAYLRDEGDGRVLVGSDARAYSHCVEILRLHCLREASLLVVHLEHSLGHGHLHDGVVAFGRAHGDFSHSGAQTGLGGENGGASHSVAACHDEGVSHLAFVGEVVAWSEDVAQLAFLLNGVACVGVVDERLREAYVEHAQFAEILLTVGEHHAELLLLEGECEVGFDDVGSNVVGVVFGHQSRRDVDAHDFCGRLVDVFHERGESSGERLVEPRAEEPVDHQRGSVEAWRVEVARDFGELLHALGLGQAFLVGGAVFGEFVVDVEKVDRDLIALLGQQTGNGKGVATIVAWSGKDHYGSGIVPFFGDDACDSLCCTLHQVDGTNGLVLDGIFV